MCGILGKLNFDFENPVQRDVIVRMCQTLRHRGPDDDGVYLDGNIGLGHTRLSIIDLSPAAHQPMSNEDGAIWIVFNGEIYNFQDLRRELELKGHRFKSSSDTETIIHLYEEYGTNCVNRLRGMFAFAIWDANKKLLLLARDRLGKKPLCYYTGDNCFIFASEPKAILSDSSVVAEPNYAAIHFYLTYQYVPSPYCAFQRMNKLPPGHTLCVRDRRMTISRYWKLSSYSMPSRKHAGPALLKSNDEQRLAKEIVERTKEAVRIRLVSDVPLGAFLSGGIDSSAIVALMTQLSDEQVKTFSIGFEEQEYNELPYARIIAKQFQTEHHEFMVKADAVDILPKLVWHYNEPYADSSTVSTYYLRLEVVQKYLDEHVAGNRNWHNQLWNLLMLELWHQKFVVHSPRNEN